MTQSIYDLIGLDTTHDYTKDQSLAEVKLNIENSNDEDDPLMRSGKYGEANDNEASNKKTSISEEEIQSPSVRTEQIFEKMDSNKDGVITENGKTFSLKK